MRIRTGLLSLAAVLAVSFAADASAMEVTRNQKILTSAAARALADA